MSRNFELLQRASANVSGVSENELQHLLSVEPRVTEKEKAHQRTIFGIDQITSEETWKLVHTVFHFQQNAPHAVLFAAINSGSGCTWICRKTAETLANAVSEDICIVDANFKTPSKRGVLGPTNQYGLADVLRTQRPVREFVRPTNLRNLWLLPSGTGTEASANLLISEKMTRLVGDLRKEFAYLLIDAPPLSTYADGIGLSHLAEGIVLVLEANVTRREVALQVAHRLRHLNTKILGAVLNKRTFPIPEAIYQRL